MNFPVLSTTIQVFFGFRQQRYRNFQISESPQTRIKDYRIQPSDLENREVRTGRNENRGTGSIIHSIILVGTIRSDRAHTETWTIAKRQSRVKMPA